MTEAEVARLAAILERVEGLIESQRTDLKDLRTDLIQQINVIHKILSDRYVTVDRLSLALATQEKALLAQLEAKTEKDPVRMAVFGTIKFIVIGFLGAVISRHIQ